MVTRVISASILLMIAASKADSAVTGVTSEGPCNLNDCICVTIEIPPVVWPDGTVGTFPPIIINGYRMPQ